MKPGGAFNCAGSRSRSTGGTRRPTVSREVRQAAVANHLLLQDHPVRLGGVHGAERVHAGVQREPLSPSHASERKEHPGVSDETNINRNGRDNLGASSGWRANRTNPVRCIAVAGCHPTAGAGVEVFRTREISFCRLAKGRQKKCRGVQRKENKKQVSPWFRTRWTATADHAMTATTPTRMTRHGRRTTVRATRTLRPSIILDAAAATARARSAPTSPPRKNTSPRRALRLVRAGRKRGSQQPPLNPWSAIARHSSCPCTSMIAIVFVLGLSIFRAVASTAGGRSAPVRGAVCRLP